MVRQVKPDIPVCCGSITVQPPGDLPAPPSNKKSRLNIKAYVLLRMDLGPSRRGRGAEIPPAGGRGLPKESALVFQNRALSAGMCRTGAESMADGFEGKVQQIPNRASLDIVSHDPNFNTGKSARCSMVGMLT